MLFQREANLFSLQCPTMANRLSFYWPTQSLVYNPRQTQFFSIFNALSLMPSMRLFRFLCLFLNIFFFCYFPIAKCHSSFHFVHSVYIYINIFNEVVRDSAHSKYCSFITCFYTLEILLIHNLFLHTRNIAHS